MDLKGRVQDLDLTAVLRLVKMSSGSGTLHVWSGSRRGLVSFRDGFVVYAEVEHAGWPLAARLLKWDLITPAQLAALQSDAGRVDGFELAVNLVRRELLDEEEVGRLLGDQIAEAFFQMLGWDGAEYRFEPEDALSTEGLSVGLDAEMVGLEGIRRLDEWGVSLAALGSLEKVPHLKATCPGERVSLQKEEWRIVSAIDGRRDVLTIAEETGMGRFATGKVLSGLVRSGLVVMKDPALELLGQSVAIALRGPIDVYNAMFLTSAATSELSTHLRVERIGDEEVEVRISAAVRDRGAAGSCLLYAPESRTPLPVIKRLALETSGFVVLVNINSRDAVLASAPDIELMRAIGDRPYVVATYASLADEMVDEGDVRELLGLEPRVSVLNCGLRDPEETGKVVELLIAMVP